MEKDKDENNEWVLVRYYQRNMIVDKDTKWNSCTL